MAIESATYISELDPANPKGSDQRGTLDDHARLIKQVFYNTLPNLGGEVSASAGELNYLVGVTSNVQAQFNNALSSVAQTNTNLLAEVSSTYVTLNNQIASASQALNTQIQTLSATLNAAKLDISATAYASDRWGGALLYIDATTASLDANMSTGDLGFLI